MATHKPDFCVILQREQEAGQHSHRRPRRTRGTCLPVPASNPPTACPSKATTRPTSSTPPAPPARPRASSAPPPATSSHSHWTMRAIYNCGVGDVFWAASDVGWVVGHSYICYAPLIAGCTTIVYEGKPVGTPDAGAFWRVISRTQGPLLLHRAHRAARHQARRSRAAKLVGDYNLTNLQRPLPRRRTRRSRHHRTGPSRHLNVPVVDHWWQTETGYAIAANAAGHRSSFRSRWAPPRVAMPGYRRARCLTKAGHPVSRPATLGAIAIKLPLAPRHPVPPSGTPKSRFKKSYLDPFPRLLRNRRRGLCRRCRRLSLHHGPHR